MFVVVALFGAALSLEIRALDFNYHNGTTIPALEFAAGIVCGFAAVGAISERALLYLVVVVFLIGSGAVILPGLSSHR